MQTGYTQIQRFITIILAVERVKVVVVFSVVLLMKAVQHNLFILLDICLLNVDILLNFVQG